MKVSAPRWILLILVLQLAILGLLLAVVVNRPDEKKGVLDEDFEDLVQEMSSARYQLKDQADRLTRLLDRLAREGAGVQGGGGASPSPIETRPLSPSELIDELAHVTAVHARFEYDPLQREVVEKERARLEDLLRRAGNDTIDALAAVFQDVASRYPELAKENQATRFQTRLLTHVVDAIGTDAAVEFAMSVFENPSINAGVRLKGAQSSLEKYQDRVVLKLVGLLEDPDPTFDRPVDIANYFAVNPDPRAIPVLIALATDVNTERTLRRAVIGALARQEDPRVIDALKQVASTELQGDLRAAALNGLNDVLKEDVVPFVRHLREQMNADDPLLQLLDQIEDLYR